MWIAVEEVADVRAVGQAAGDEDAVEAAAVDRRGPAARVLGFEAANGVGSGRPIRRISARLGNECCNLR